MRETFRGRQTALAVLLLTVSIATFLLLHSSVHENEPRVPELLEPGHAASLRRRDLVPLRLLPVGDSITFGAQSSDGNGYRLDLRTQLVNEGYTVDFIGSQSNGQNNPDNQHEGFPLNTIKNISDHMTTDGILFQHPNLVLVHAGTNDNNVEFSDQPYAGAPDRLGKLIDQIVCECYDAVVLVAKLVQCNSNQTQTDYFNSHVFDEVNARYKQGYKVVMVDQSGVGGDQLADGVHPNDAGYQAMANNWLNAINALPSDWLTAARSPSVSTGSANEVCAKSASSLNPAISGNALFAGAHAAGDPGESGSDSSSGPQFVPQWDDQGSILIGVGRPGSGQLYADLNGDGLADYLWINHTTGDMSAWLNEGKNKYNPVFEGNAIRWGTGNGAGVRVADLTGDGKVEYIQLYDNGAMRVWENQGPNGDVWNWSELSDVNGNWAPDGVTTTSVIFGDINGDKKADMGVARSDGTIDFYLAQGDIGTSSFSWLECKDAAFWIDNPNIRLVDLDGDGYADFLSIDKDGAVKGYLGVYSGGCKITFNAVNNAIEKGVALMSSGEAALTQLADVDGDGKIDYMAIGADTASVHLWLNKGYMHFSLATTLTGYAAGVRFADLDGDGQDDYVSVGENGGIIYYTNGGQSGSGWVWNEGDNGQVSMGNTGASRHQVLFADLNGDGRDDYLVVDDESGAVTAWLNNGLSGGAISWGSKGVILTGLGRDGGVGVRFADMNGDGRDDYIYLDKDGAATVWINNGTGDDLLNWYPMNNRAPAAIGVGAAREDVRIADYDGDGLADYIWVHPDDGSVDLWYNAGPLADALGWTHEGTIFPGAGTFGRNIEFAVIGSSGRADLVLLDESDGSFRAWINTCSQVVGTKTTTGGATGGSDSGCHSPPLPSPSTTVDQYTQAYIDALALSDTADDGNATVESIRLIRFDGCSNMPGVSNAEAQIYSGWQQAQKIMNVKSISEGTIDFNSAAALDYLGAPGLNKDGQQAMINLVEVYRTLKPAWWPFGYRLHVRCDDPANYCPCGDGDETYAYTSNKDPDSGIAAINFCPRYFRTKTLNNAIKSGKKASDSRRLNLNTYWDTQGSVFTHELMHVDWVSSSNGIGGRFGPYDHIVDLEIEFRDEGGLKSGRAYGPANTKILARFPRQTGYWVRRNADNMNCYLLSQYVQQELGNIYPHFPLVKVDKPLGSPRVPRQPYASLFIVGDNNSVTLNSSNPLAAAFGDANAQQCSGDTDESPAALTIDSFADDSEYPSDYISDYQDWLADQTQPTDPEFTEGPYYID